MKTLTSISIKSLLFGLIILIITIILIVRTITVYRRSYRLPPLPPLPLPIPKIDRFGGEIKQSTSSQLNTNIFPKIIHHMWIDNNIPISLNRWVEGCKQVNNDYKFMFYNDYDLLTFVTDNYPDFLEFYKSLSK